MDTFPTWACSYTYLPGMDFIVSTKAAALASVVTEHVFNPNARSITMWRFTRCVFMCFCSSSGIFTGTWPADLPWIPQLRSSGLYMGEVSGPLWRTYLPDDFTGCGYRCCSSSRGRCHCRAQYRCGSDMFLSHCLCLPAASNHNSWLRARLGFRFPCTESMSGMCG